MDSRSRPPSYAPFAEEIRRTSRWTSTIQFLQQPMWIVIARFLTTVCGAAAIASAIYISTEPAEYRTEVRRVFWDDSPYRNFPSEFNFPIGIVCFSFAWNILLLLATLAKRWVKISPSVIVRTFYVVLFYPGTLLLFEILLFAVIITCYGILLNILLPDYPLFLAEGVPAIICGFGHIVLFSHDCFSLVRYSCGRLRKERELKLQDPEQANTARTAPPPSYRTHPTSDRNRIERQGSLETTNTRTAPPTYRTHLTSNRIRLERLFSQETITTRTAPPTYRTHTASNRSRLVRSLRPVERSSTPSLPPTSSTPSLPLRNPRRSVGNPIVAQTTIVPAVVAPGIYAMNESRPDLLLEAHPQPNDYFVERGPNSASSAPSSPR